MASESQQTLGIELEFIVFYTTPGEQAPAKDEKRYGPVLECPYYSEITPPPGFVIDESVNYPKLLEAAWVRQKVADVIASVGFKSKASLEAKGSELDLFEFWNVVPDLSVRLPLDFDQAYSPLKHAGVEVNSPVFAAGEEAFKEISAVIGAINSAFRTTIPPVCGFHVHVGRGYKPLELRPVQRTASLLWLAENLIDTLHPGCRHRNKQCFSMRGFSDMTRSLDIEHKNKNIGEDFYRPRESNHAEFSRDRVDKNRKKPTQYEYNRPLDATDSPWSTLSGSLALDYSMSFREPDYEGLPCGLEMMDGIRMILNTMDSAEVAAMTSFEDNCRGAYNFSNMESEQGASSTRKPTIEFRQAAGSLDKDWIIIWAKICLALNGPVVVESSDDDFFQLLYNCEEGYRTSQRQYDVFDLLHDIGLCKEDIDAVHSRLVSGRHEREPVLAFHRADDTEEGALDEGYGLGWQRGIRYDNCSDVTTPEGEDWLSGAWDDIDGCNDGSSNSSQTDEAWVDPVVNGFSSLSVEEDDCLAEPL